MTLAHPLEQNIRETYRLKCEYEEIIQLSADPNEKTRARKAIEQHQTRLLHYLGQYVRLCRDTHYAMRQDIVEIISITGIDAEQVAGTHLSAADLLAALPTDTIPAPAPLPPISRMPYPSNPLFVGREDELCLLARILLANEVGATGQVAAIVGMGGMGKTQLATEFVHCYGSYFAGGVFWLSFADHVSVQAEVAECGMPRYLDLPGFTSLTFHDKVQRVLDAWHNDIPRLLVFDNCEDEQTLQQWRPTAGGCRVLITCRKAQWQRSMGVQIVALNTLPRPKSITLLQNYLGYQELEHRNQKAVGTATLSLSSAQHTAPSTTHHASLITLNSIAATLGDLPLALHLAGSFLEQGLVTPDEYLEELESKGLTHPSLEGEDIIHSPTEHDLSVRSTFNLSYRQLQADNEVDAVAIQLLARAACFAAGEPFPTDLLIATLHLPEDDTQARRQARRAAVRLKSLGLLEAQHAPHGGEDGWSSREGDTLQLNRLLAAFAKEVAQDPQARADVEQTMLQTISHLMNTGDPRSLQMLQPHLHTITDEALQRTRHDTTHTRNRAAELCSALDYYLDTIGDYTGAHPYSEQALAVRQQTLGNDHPDTALSLNNLGMLLSAQGDFGAARPYLEQALAVRRKVLGDRHPHTATSFNNLGYLFSAQGDFATARPYLEWGLAIRLEVLGNDHPETATSLNNLGYLLSVQGDFGAAHRYYEQALAIRQQVLGDYHHLTATSLNNLGSLFKEQGDFGAAHRYYEQALAIRQQVLGDHHPQTARSLNNLGYLLQAQGDFDAARRYYEQALAIRQQVLGNNHPETATSLNNLGYLLSAQGDFGAARPYLEQALAIHQHVFGNHHPHTAGSLNNLGYLLSVQGDFATARRYYERALVIYQDVLGKYHPDTARSFNNLGHLLQAQGDFGAARRYYEQALAIRRQVLGDYHTDTAQSLNNLGYLLRVQDDFGTARRYYERALAIRQQVLGDRHPHTATSLNNLGALLRAKGDFGAARPYLEQALVIRQQVLGDRHPHTATSLNNLAVLSAYEGDYQQAATLMHRVLAIREEILGTDHPDTQSSRQNLHIIEERLQCL